MSRRKTHAYWPSHFYGPNGQDQVFNSAEEVPAGWEDHPSKLKAGKQAPAPAAAASTGDDTGAGSDTKPLRSKVSKPAGKKAKTAPNPLTVARKAYKDALGKNPSPKLTVDDLNKAIAEKLGVPAEGL